MHARRMFAGRGYARFDVSARGNPNGNDARARRVDATLRLYRASVRSAQPEIASATRARAHWVRFRARVHERMRPGDTGISLSGPNVGFARVRTRDPRTRVRVANARARIA
jgi:hypothetical protein